MRFVSFFAGVGGFDLGLERCGHECVAQVEIDPYALRVLECHWPDVPRFGDIRTLDPWSLPDADLWSGGFPCQPFSVAGKRAATEDERDLWPAWCRLIAVRRPRWIFGENVPGLLSAEGGAAWGRLVRDLAALGYVGEWTVLAARDVGAPHRRERLWIVAHLADARSDVRSQGWPRERPGVLGRKPGSSRDTRRQQAVSPECRGELADADERGREERSERDGISATGLAAPRGHDAHGCDSAMADAAIQRGHGSWRARGRGAELANGGRAECWCGRGEPWCCDPADEPFADANIESQDRTAIPRGQRGDGPAQPRLGRVAHGIPRRVDRLRCLGNAVVPQVVEAIARKVWG